jgi:LmbE family N-acetylglucosaminyl deacetylase
LTTLVVSPHLDDAVLSAGLLLVTRPGAVVVTVMAGYPGPGVLSDWDRSCGFVDGDDPVARRREEDHAALSVLGARAAHLEFLDQPYRVNRATGDGGSAEPQEIAGGLVEVVREVEPVLILIPLGLLHPDHILTHQAGLRLRRSTAIEVWAYRDLPYALARPDLVTSQLAVLERSGVRAHPVSVANSPNAERKLAAIACYASQVDAVRDDLGHDAWDGTLAPGSERFWRLADE